MGILQERIGMTLVAGGIVGAIGVVGSVKEDAPALCDNPKVAVANFDTCYEEESGTGALVVLGSLASIAAGAKLCVSSANSGRSTVRRRRVDIDTDSSYDFDGD